MSCQLYSSIFSACTAKNYASIVTNYFHHFSISKCGLTEGLTKLSRISNEYGDDDKDSLLIFKREGNYDYD